jgi:hypothetical protein
VDAGTGAGASGARGGAVVVSAVVAAGAVEALGLGAAVALAAGGDAAV